MAAYQYPQHDVAWSAPGSPSDLPRARRGGATTLLGDDAAPRGVVRALPGSPLARLQPRTVGQLLDGGFDVVKFRFRHIATIAAVLILPLYGVPAMFGAELSSSRNPFSLLGGLGQVSVDSQASSSAGIVGAALAAQAGLLLARLLMGLAIGHLVVSWLFGRDPSVGETLRHVGRRSGVAILAWLVLLPVKVLGSLACGLGLFYLLPVFAILAPVVSVEGAGPIASIKRTHRLSLRRYGPVIGIWALWFLVGQMTQAASGLITGLLGSALRDVGWGWAVTGSLTVGFNSVWLAVEVAVWALVYVDIRVRTEGLDIGFDISEQFTRAGA